MNALGTLCPRCGTGILVSSVGRGGVATSTCPHCDSLSGGEMESLALDTPDFGTFGGPLPDLGDLSAIDQLGALEAAPAAGGGKDDAPPLLDDLLLGEPGDAPAAPAKQPGQAGLDLFL
ncbi:MAG TPA: hypothetical protein VGG33_18260, partial [Polyangia bacterium]